MVASSSLSFDGMTLERAIDVPFVALTTTAKRGLTVMVSQKPLTRMQNRDKSVSEAVVLYNHAHAVVKSVPIHDRKRCTVQPDLDCD